jgi:hypothetical protein
MAPPLAMPVSAPGSQPGQQTQDIAQLESQVQQQRLQIKVLQQNQRAMEQRQREMQEKEARDALRADKKAYVNSYINLWTAVISQKVLMLGKAADKISEAFAYAAAKHRQAVADAKAEKEKAEAASAQIMFSIVTFFAAGAFSWVGNWGKSLAMSAGAQTIKQRIDRGLNFIDFAKSSSREEFGSALDGVFDKLGTKFSAQLNRKLVPREIFIDTFKDTVQAAIGEGFSATGPIWGGSVLVPPGVDKPLDIEPTAFAASLREHVADLVLGPQQFLTVVSGVVNALMNPKVDALWDLFDVDTFANVWDDWQKKLDQYGEEADLHALDPNDMKRDLEKFIWAIWILGSGLKDDPVTVCTDNELHSPGQCQTGRDWIRVRTPIDDRFVELGIETPAQTDRHRGEEDPWLINWAKNYINNEAAPWVKRAMKDQTLQSS